MTEADEAGQVLARLVAYWQANLQAADDAEGIRQWWLADAPVSRHALDIVLQGLVDDGRVIAVTAVDGRVRYRWSAGVEKG
jgi:hypothetical protein